MGWSCVRGEEVWGGVGVRVVTTDKCHHCHIKSRS